MRKLNLLFAGALVLCGLNVQAQELMWSEDFESGLNFFTDSAKIDSIVGLDYYIGRTAGNGTWDVDTHKDGFLHLDLTKKPIYLYHAIAPVVGEFRQDEYSIEEDSKGSHAAAMKKLGGIGGSYWLKYVSGPSSHNFASYGGSEDGIVNDYQANVFVRGLQIEPNSPYRVTYFMNMYSPVDSAQMEVRVMRGYYDSEKAFTTNGESGAPEFIKTVMAADVNNPQGENWERYSYVTYYTNDSIANKALHRNGYWWTAEWADTLWHNRAQFPDSIQKKFANNEDLDSATTAKWGWIVQPNTYYLRFAFRGPHATYQVDDIALYNSWIGGAEWCGDMMRVDFGYKTNLIEIANSDGVGQVEVPADAYVLTANDDEGEPVVFSADPEIATDPEYNTILAAEFHNDGYLYLWITDEFELYDDIRFSLLNSKLPDDMKLKYTDEKLYPKANDAEWVAAGKIVPDIENEIVLQGDFSAVRRDLLPPTAVTTTPEANSFNLVPDDFKTLTVKFNKPVLVSSKKSVNAIIGNTPLANPRYVADTYCTEVEFDVPAKVQLSGTVEVTITNALAADSLGNEAEGATAADVKSFNFYFTDPAAALADTTSEAYKNYALLEEALGNLADKVDACDANITMYGGAAYDAAAGLLAKYEIDAFYASHKAPSQYSAASDELKKSADDLQNRINNVDKYVALKDKYDAFLTQFAAYSGKKEYITLSAIAAEIASTDITKMSNEDVSAMVPSLQEQLTKLSAPIYTIEYSTKQIKSLDSLNVKLGVQYADGVADAIAAAENDNQELAKVLKLYATKAIYEKIAADGAIDTLDATGFLTNAKLYATGQLGKEIVEEFYQYSQYNRYHIVTGKEFTTVLPGWTISSSAGSVMCGTHPDRGYEGGYYVEPGFAIDGAVWADWTSQFTLTQTATNLPNGVYTLAANFGGGEDNIANQYVTANGDSVAAATGQNPDPVYLEGIKVTENKMDIKANHQGCNAWARLNEFSMQFTGAVEGFDYAAEAAKMDEKINEALTVVDAAEVDAADAKFYNFNGIEAKEGLLIKVQNGKASKIFR